MPGLTHRVLVDSVLIGGGAPVVVQAMTNTNTEDALSTAEQCAALAAAGAELVRITVNTPRAAEAVPEIVLRLRDAGYPVPLIGDFHYNGHKLLQKHPQCAEALAKYRINPGNVGQGDARAIHFSEICAIARDLKKPVRIGVNAGSLDQALLEKLQRENLKQPHPDAAQEVFNRCMVLSTLQSAEQALEAGLSENQIILSCKSSQPVDLITVYRSLAEKTRQPLHLGLTEAGLGAKGLIWSAAAMGILLEAGIGDTIRVSLTPEPGGDRCGEVYAAQELLQALGLRQFSPSVTACPGCGRTSGDAFQRLAADTQAYIRMRLPLWREQYPGVETLKVAVMGCVVNGPGESRAAHIGISLPGSNEAPLCPVYMDGEKQCSLQGSMEEITRSFLGLLEDYVIRRFGTPESAD
ncbi:MAG TPA: flavodoxin-dependent (E)-4-hydroxy-3-methylbut-2-enyl-diphosphate synthase [Candidatus Hydrogenedentes bacterium]|nr:flavodoxin-dependent (E)-4-hydroxy-3-methylbut-2-enyl-diphosphate synthase [Candidatus Hydrogenedentota bacterium]